MTNPVTGPVLDPAPNPVSPKVIISTVLALVVPGVIAVVTYVGANQDVLGINNPILGVLITALVPGILTFLGGFLSNDPLRTEGRRSLARRGLDADGDGRFDYSS